MRRSLLRILLGLAAAVEILFFALPLLLVPARFATLRGWMPSHDAVLRGLGVSAAALGIGAILAAREPEHHRGIVLVTLLVALGAGGLGIFSISMRGGNGWIAVDSALFLLGGAGLAFLFSAKDIV
jgi:hypothetical protein